MFKYLHLNIVMLSFQIKLIKIPFNYSVITPLVMGHIILYLFIYLCLELCLCILYSPLFLLGKLVAFRFQILHPQEKAIKLKHRLK